MTSRQMTTGLKRKNHAFGEESWGSVTRGERVVQTLKHEVLNGFCVVSERHMVHILRRTADWYNFRRYHSARGNLPPVRDSDGSLVVDL